MRRGVYIKKLESKMKGIRGEVLGDAYWVGGEGRFVGCGGVGGVGWGWSCLFCIQCTRDSSSPPQCEHWASLARAAAIKYRISIHFITFHRAAPLLHSVLIALDHISW